jgi:DNA-directed RNA polymerase specialized sigma24 family protein
MNYIDKEAIGETDQDLLERIKRDDKDAFKILFHKHYKQVYYLVYKSTGNEQLCATMIHDVFLQLWESRHIPTISSLDVYLFALTSTKIFEVVNESKSDNNMKTPASFKERLLGLRPVLKLRRPAAWHWNSSQN